MIAGWLLICGPLIAKGIIGKQFGELALAWSLPTWFAGILFIATAVRLQPSCLGSQRCANPTDRVCRREARSVFRHTVICSHFDDSHDHQSP